MGEHIKLTASDGHELGGYRANPEGKRRGGVVVLQEIFGVNPHIRDVCDRFAAEGYVAIAPALYDRSSQQGVELGYDKDAVALGRQLREEFSWDDTVKDVESARGVLASEGLRVGTVGYCWGGTISFLASTRLDVQAAVVYYGGQIKPYMNERARCPLMMHFGARDASIPIEDVESLRLAHPDAQVFVYDADHGFNCDRRAQFDETAAAMAAAATLELFRENLT